MRTELKTTLAALLAATVSTGAMAQVSATTSDPLPKAGASAGADVGAGANVSTDMASVGADASGAADAEFDSYGKVIADLNGKARTKADVDTAFSDIASETDVEVVLLSELKGNATDEAAALDRALAEMDAELDDLHRKIETNGTIKAALDDEGFEPEQVVTWNLDAEGDLVLVIDDRS